METESLFLHLWETAEGDPVSKFDQDAPEILNCFVILCVKYLQGVGVQLVSVLGGFSMFD